MHTCMSLPHTQGRLSHLLNLSLFIVMDNKCKSVTENKDIDLTHYNGPTGHQLVGDWQSGRNSRKASKSLQDRHPPPAASLASSLDPWHWHTLRWPSHYPLHPLGTEPLLVAPPTTTSLCPKPLSAESPLTTLNVQIATVLPANILLPFLLQFPVHMIILHNSLFLF